MSEPEDEELAFRRARRKLEKAMQLVLLNKEANYVEQAQALVFEAIRDSTPWKPHPDGGLVYHWTNEAGSFEDRWDGKSLTINRSATLRGAVEFVSVDCSIKEDA